MAWSASRAGRGLAASVKPLFQPAMKTQDNRQLAMMNRMRSLNSHRPLRAAGPAGQTGGAQTTGDDQPSQETEQPQATTSQQPEQDEDTGARSPQATLVLTAAQQKIKNLIVEHNIEVEEMEVIAVIAVIAVIGRLASDHGSLTKGIQILTIVNPLVLKGKDVTDDEWRDVFDLLEESGIEIRN